MSAKIQKKYSVNAAGELHISVNDNIMTLTNVDTGEVFELTDILSDFDGRDVKITCNYAEDIA